MDNTSCRACSGGSTGCRLNRRYDDTSLEDVWLYRMYDNGTYTVTMNQDGSCTVVVNYRTAPDIYEANVHTALGSMSYGTNFGSAPAHGSLTWTFVVPAKPTWVQVDGF